MFCYSNITRRCRFCMDCISNNFWLTKCNKWNLIQGVFCKFLNVFQVLAVEKHWREYWENTIPHRSCLRRFSELRTTTPSLMTRAGPLKSFLPISPDFASKEAKISFLLTGDEDSGLELKFGTDLEAKIYIQMATEEMSKRDLELCVLVTQTGGSYNVRKRPQERSISSTFNLFVKRQYAGA